MAKRKKSTLILLVILAITITLVVGALLVLSIWNYQQGNIKILIDRTEVLWSDISTLKQTKNAYKQGLIDKIIDIQKEISELKILDQSKKVELDKKIVELNQKVNDLPEETIDIKEGLTLKKEILTIESELKNSQNTVQNTVLTTSIQGFGGLFFIVTAVISWFNYKATEDKQIAERFSQAVDLLGKENNIACNLGGIYALEQIAKDSPEKYHWTVMEVLTSFIQNRSPLSSDSQANQVATQDDFLPVSTDVQAALTVIGRRGHQNDPKAKTICLDSTNLTKANLQGAYLQRANLETANLEGANLKDAYLKGAYLQGANLRGANLKNAYLQGAYLQEANLEGADFSKSHLEGAHLNLSELKNTDIREAYLQGADFTGTDPQESAFEGSYRDERTRGLPKTQINQSLS